MVAFRGSVSLVLALGAILFASSFSAQAQKHHAWIEVKGMPTQIDQSAGTFMMESLKVTTTPATRFEDRNDHHVDKATFFSDLHQSDWVEVEGSLQGNTITAREIEIKTHR